MSTLTARRGLLTLAVATALLVGSFAVASSASASTLYACVKKSGSAHVFAKKPKCKKGETKLSWGSTGSAGKNGAAGAQGGAGKEGAQGKEGIQGKTGLEGSAFAYAEVSSVGKLGNEKGVVKMTPGSSPSAGTYCFDIPGTLHNAVATANAVGGGTTPSIEEIDLAPIIEVIFGSCSSETTMAVHTFNVKGESVEAGFFLAVN
jgi:hypothetical protein